MSSGDRKQASGQEPRQVCTRCVMDASAPDIIFDSDGICQYCREFSEVLDRPAHADPAERERALEVLVERVKAQGRGRPYDCIIGVSGGADSSWALVRAVELGLRPLAVHMDNGWDSELAAHNIHSLVNRLGVDLYTHVINWAEYRELMQGFFDADVIDVEILYDNAMTAVNYDQARRFGLKSILAGTNTSTEGMRMPPGWNWYKKDVRNIRAMGQSRRVKLRTFPHIGTMRWVWLEYVRRVKWISFLDYTAYDKPTVMKELVERFEYKPYPYKHYESVFTRFYQGYILPRKFGVDKRRLHLSALVVTGVMTRDEALGDLAEIAYPTERALEDDLKYFLKKMAWSVDELETYMARPPRPHTDFPSERQLYVRLRDLHRRLASR